GGHPPRGAPVESRSRRAIAACRARRRARARRGRSGSESTRRLRERKARRERSSSGDGRRNSAFSISSAQRKAPYRDGRAEETRDPEARRDSRLLPPEELEVMVERSAPKDPPTAEPVGRDLKDHRERLRDQNAPEDEEEELVPKEHGHEPDRPAERKRAGVAHEDLRRMTVEPQEAEARAAQGRAPDGDLARILDVEEPERGAHRLIADDERERREGRRHQRARADREAI